MSDESGVEITWLGHATFVLTGPDGERVLVDPFLASNPSCPESMREVGPVDIIAITHGHFDHVADVGVAYEQGQPDAVVAIVEVAHWLRGQGIPSTSVVEMNKGGTVAVAGVEITMVDAKHSAGIAEGEQMLYGGEAAGMVFRFSDGTSIYHAGDTCAFTDMALIGELHRPAVALLPIGDHYTMGPREAAMACELLGAPRVVPMHYGTFPVLTGTPEALRAACAERGVEVEVLAPAPGDSVR